MTGRSHRRRQSLAAHANLERFLDREIVRLILEFSVAFAAYDFFRTDSVQPVFS